MNIHVTQSPVAESEVRNIMNVSSQIMSPQGNRPVMGIVQDSLLGAFLMTRKAELISRSDMMEFVCWINFKKGIRRSRQMGEAAVLYPREMWTGAQLLSCTLPPNFHLSKWKVDGTWPDKDSVIIRNGMLQVGTTKKQLLGTSGGGIIDVITRRYGSSLTLQTMTNIQRVVNTWLMKKGFSVGISDCVLKDEAQKSITDSVTSTIKHIDNITRDATDSMIASQAESTKLRILSRLLMHTGGIVEENMGSNNAIRCMVQAGSKGTPINLSQICAQRPRNANAASPNVSACCDSVHRRRVCGSAICRRTQNHSRQRIKNAAFF